MNVQTHLEKQQDSKKAASSPSSVPGGISSTLLPATDQPRTLTVTSICQQFVT